MVRKDEAEKVKKRGKKKRNAVPYGKNSPEYVIARRRKTLRDREEISTFLTRLFMMALFLYVVFGRIYGLGLVENDDMKPRMSGGDLMLYYRLANSWYIDDIAVFEKDGETYTGRIVAAGGDSVDISDEGGLIINGNNIVEDDIFYVTKKYDTGIDLPVTLGENEFFVLCDYREGAKDSRFFGPVKASEIKGKVITILRRTNL